jgi:hypothetical protein
MAILQELGVTCAQRNRNDDGEDGDDGDIAGL